ncbi:hypothetical protein VNO77_02962 [Canavalia gladiata]|uniref:Uncharacterized protein n=1 Tax=Canavalia gladiata TaxID=3824 RepID=A0AAN9MYW5_CANGL
MGVFWVLVFLQPYHLQTCSGIGCGICSPYDDHAMPQAKKREISEATQFKSLPKTSLDCGGKEEDWIPTRIPLELEINSPGSYETSSVDFEVVFQGIRVNKKEVILQGSEASVRIEAETLLHTPLLAKILEGLVSRSNVKDKIHHDEEVIDAANEMICSVNREELAKSFALKVIQRMRKQRISKKDEPNHLLANIESLKKMQKKM